MNSESVIGLVLLIIVAGLVVWQFLSILRVIKRNKQISQDPELKEQVQREKQLHEKELEKRPWYFNPIVFVIYAIICQQIAASFGGRSLVYFVLVTVGMLYIHNNIFKKPDEK